MDKNGKYVQQVERYCSSVDKNVTFNVFYDDKFTENRECANYDSCENKTDCFFCTQSKEAQNVK